MAAIPLAKLPNKPIINAMSSNIPRNESSPNMNLEPRHTCDGQVVKLTTGSRLFSKKRLRRSRERRKFFRFQLPTRSRIVDDRYAKLIKVNGEYIQQGCYPALVTTGEYRSLNSSLKVDQHPRGYPRTAVYLNSDDDSALFRRFGDLHARTLLYLQAELTELEEKLAKIDLEDSKDPSASWKVGHSIHVKGGRRNEVRRELMLQIKENLKEYAQLVLQDSGLRKLPRPSRKNFLNVFNWVYTENAFGAGEQHFIYHEKDFISLQEYENNWLDDKVNHFIGYFCNRGIFCRIFSSSEDLGKTQDPFVSFHSKSRVAMIIKITMAVVSTALLLIPIFIFLATKLSAIRMAATTLIFSFAFATAISFFTSAKRQEVFAITAAYCAVLVVFIGNLQQNQSSHVE